MKFFIMLLCCFFAHQALPAFDYGFSGFHSDLHDLPYTVHVPVFPAKTPLSSNRNQSDLFGPYEATSGGIKIKEDGKYNLSFLVEVDTSASVALYDNHIVLVANNNPDDVLLHQESHRILRRGHIIFDSYNEAKDLKGGTVLSLFVTNKKEPDALILKHWHITISKSN